MSFSSPRTRTVDSFAFATTTLNGARSFALVEICAEAGAAVAASTRATTRERAVIGRDSEIKCRLGEGESPCGGKRVWLAVGVRRSKTGTRSSILRPLIQPRARSAALAEGDRQRQGLGD